MTSWTGDTRYDLELMGFPWSEPGSAASAMAPAFGITVEEALLYVQEAPLVVVKGASEHVICEYVRALHTAGATLKVVSREGSSWTVAAPTPVDPAFWAGEVPFDEGDTLPTWLLEAVPDGRRSGAWLAGPSDSQLGSELPDEASPEDLRDEDFVVVDLEPPRYSARRPAAAPPRRAPSRAQPTAPTAASRAEQSGHPPRRHPGGAAPTDAQGRPLTVARREQRGSERDSSNYYAALDVSHEKNPFLERASTDEVFRQGLALVRAEREKNADPLDEFLRRARHPGDSSRGEKKKKRKR